MAKQKSVIKLSGTVDDMTYYQNAGEYFSRKKTSVTAERIASDPQFERTRENMSEFGRGFKASKLFRDSIKDLLKLAADPRMSSRLGALIVKVAKTDPVNERGKRTVTLGDLTLLHNFQCNNQASLSDAFTGSFTAVIDRNTGNCTVTVEDFISKDMVSIPDGATHFKFVTAGTELNFEEATFVAESGQTTAFAWDFTPISALTMVTTVTPKSTNPIFLLVGMLFFQVVNGKQYPMKEESFNPLSIVTIDTTV